MYNQEVNRLTQWKRWNSELGDIVKYCVLWLTAAMLSDFQRSRNWSVSWYFHGFSISDKSWSPVRLKTRERPSLFRLRWRAMFNKVWALFQSDYSKKPRVLFIIVMSDHQHCWFLTDLIINQFYLYSNTFPQWKDKL